MNSSQLIYAAALKDLGLHETDGRESTPRILEAIKAAADWLERDDSVTAWCGCIRGLWAIETKTGAPRDFYRAKSWLAWGSPVGSLAQAQQGDTIIMKRPGGFHVGLYTGEHTARTFKMLGGNQSNRVSIVSQPIAAIVGIRR